MSWFPTVSHKHAFSPVWTTLHESFTYNPLPPTFDVSCSTASTQDKPASGDTCHQWVQLNDPASPHDTHPKCFRQSPTSLFHDTQILTAMVPHKLDQITLLERQKEKENRNMSTMTSERPCLFASGLVEFSFVNKEIRTEYTGFPAMPFMP